MAGLSEYAKQRLLDAMSTIEGECVEISGALTDSGKRGTMTVRDDMGQAGEFPGGFPAWIAEARLYAMDCYGSDTELGSDEDMQSFYDDAYDPRTAVDEVFSEGDVA